MWKNGKTDGCEYWVKSYDEPSIYGINEGRISKLTVKRDEREIMSFDRGWDLEPKTDADREILARILAKYN
jgi:hypothetical protein